jgi:hypothetical protein
MNTAEQNRKVADIHRELLLKVDLELLARGGRAAEDGPGPVVLVVHDPQEG